MSYKDELESMYVVTGRWLNIDDQCKDDSNYDPEIQSKWDRINHIAELAKEYHDRCDAFDRNICTGKNRYGESMPVSSWQLKEVNRNSLLVLIELNERIKNNTYGVTTDELIKAIQSYKF